KQWMPDAAVHLDGFVEYPLSGDVASADVRNAQAQVRGAVGDAADGLVSNHGFHTQADFASSSFAKQLQCAWQLASRIRDNLVLNDEDDLAGHFITDLSDIGPKI